mgnify:CR=1 FL=1
MTQPEVANPHPPEFERFLYAPVGEDRNGYVVTVLSALARLGLDPWAETADLVTLGRDAARTRLGAMLKRFRDVPLLARDHGKVARDLSQLLPEAPTPGAKKGAASNVDDGRPGMTGMILTVLAIAFVLYQVLTSGGPGVG